MNKIRVTLILLLTSSILVFLIVYVSLRYSQTATPAATRNLSDSAPQSQAAAPGAQAPVLDSDSDGLPDATELTSYAERDSFRRWFTRIAEMQFYRLSNQWNSEQRDCAGLVRFSFREALRRHDRLWFQKMGPGYEAIAPDVRNNDREDRPLGEKLFRTDFGRYEQGDIASGRLSDFADARALKSFNTVFVGRDRRQARAGDLIFFYQPWVQKFPYHVMIFLGEPGVDPNGNGDWVVYHTGSSATDEGTVKKVELSVLDHHPDPRWRPLESNRNFLGFFRLKILD